MSVSEAEACFDLLASEDTSDSHENPAKFVLAGPVFLSRPELIRAELGRQSQWGAGVEQRWI